MLLSNGGIHPLCPERSPLRPPCSYLGENKPRDGDLVQQLKKLLGKTSPSSVNEAMQSNPGDEFNAVCLPCDTKHTLWVWRGQRGELCQMGQSSFLLREVI